MIQIAGLTRAQKFIQLIFVVILPITILAIFDNVFTKETYLDFLTINLINITSPLMTTQPQWSVMDLRLILDRDLINLIITNVIDFGDWTLITSQMVMIDLTDHVNLTPRVATIPQLTM